MAEDLQNQGVDTVVETETVPEQGTVAEVQVDTAPVAETTTEEMVSRKELEKAIMRQNQLAKELESARISAQNAGNDDLVQELASKLAAIEAEKEQEAQQAKIKAYESTLENVFDKVSEKYPESVKKAAKLIKDRIGIGAIVKDTQFSFEAEEQIKTLLDGLNKEVIVEKPEIKVEAQNLPYTPEAPKEMQIGEGSQSMGSGEEDYLSRIAKESFKSIGIEI